MLLDRNSLTMNAVFTSVLVALCFTYTTCYPSGAPIQACPTLAPIHANTTPQASPSPYGIKVDSTQWSAGKPLRVSITGGPVHGFILQARRNSDGSGIGSFDNKSLPVGSQAGPCMLLGRTISVTHTNPDPKVGLEFMWMMPSSENYDGDIYFQGTVADDHDTYWTNIKSNHIVSEMKTSQTIPHTTTTHREMTTTPHKKTTHHDKTTKPHKMTTKPHHKTTHHDMTTNPHKMTTKPHHMTTHHDKTTKPHKMTTKPHHMSTHHDMTTNPHSMSTKPHHMTTHHDMTTHDIITSTSGDTTHKGDGTMATFSVSLLLLSFLSFLF